ncbi:RNA-guided endonuclease TnpB family protein [Streptomyces sp. NPDC002078]
MAPDVSAVVLQQSLRDLDTAYKNFFDSVRGKRHGRKVGPSRYRSKKDTRQSIRLATNALPDGQRHGVRGQGRQPQGQVVPAPSGRPRFLRRAEKQLKRLQRELARKAKGSKNRAKARIEVAHQHTKVADRRRDWHHKASTRIIRDNQAVYVEDLAVSGLGRTRLAKSVHDAGWSAFVGMLEYKAVRHGRTFAMVDRAFPSSQVCSTCGLRDGRKPLHIREWTCGECATVHDRDHEAARKRPVRRTANRRHRTGGDAKRLWSAGETGTRAVEAGSPRKGHTTQAGSPGL